ncbi:MAG: dockerin type I repeat-containing protein [bacterium]
MGAWAWDTLATATNVFLCDDYLIDDDTEGESWGNGDGVIDAGEVIELSVRVRYIGEIPATQVYGLLSISRANPHIELLDSLAAFGDAFGDTTLMCRNSFRFAVSEWCSEDHLIEFTLEITDSAGNTWEESLEVFVNSATDIVCNGDFSSGDISCWSFYHTSYTPVPTWNVVDDPEMGQALKITRSDPEPWEWARSSLVQTLHDADLSDPLLLLSFDVKVSYQNPSCSEYWWYGFPASFFLRYEDTMGEYYDLRRSFYYFGWSPDPLAEKIAQDTWVHRVYDLTFLAPSAAEFTQIKLFCDGYGWDVSFDNVEILLAEPGRAKGDINGDRYVNVLDVVLAAKIVIGTYRPTAVEHWAADTTNDGRVDVADVVGIVNIIIGTSP